MIRHHHFFQLLFAGYLLLFGCFFIYSYTQVDLNLTLSSHPLYQLIQRQLTYVGYFNRPISGSALILLLTALWIIYFITIRAVAKDVLQKRHVVYMIAVSLILVFAYPAFSHDFFNYMFDARIVTKYGLDPSHFKALDFPVDTWTRFMRWTHRYYPYGPGWLLLTLVPSYLGFGKFVVTLFLFKGLFAIAHVGNSWLLHRMNNNKRSGLILAAYALNPLILTESLVSPHNEVLMLFGVLLAFYLLLRNNLASLLALIASISMKYVSAVLLPLWFVAKYSSRSKLFIYAFYAWLVALVPLILMREPYSWYFIPLVALALLTEKSLPFAIATGLSAGTLVRYIPFIIWGDYGIRSQNTQLYLFVSVTAIISFYSYSVWEKNRTSQ